MKTTNDEFKVRYEIDDGYAGGSRPQYVSISACSFECGMDEVVLDGILEDVVQEDFETKISWYVKNKEEYLK